MTTQRVLSYQIADSIDVKQFKSVFKGELYYSDSDEYFIKPIPANTSMCLNMGWFAF